MLGRAAIAVAVVVLATVAAFFGLAARLAVAAFFGLAARLAGARLNRVDTRRRPPPVSDRARQLHASLRIVDLHDDLLLWARDPLRCSAAGHSDLPRLVAGNVAVEIFSTVTKVPRRQDHLRNSADADAVTLLAIAARWPPRTWRGLLARALHQAARLRVAAARSGGRLVIASSRQELSSALRERAARPDGDRCVVAILSTEGLHAIEGRLEHVDTLFAHGFRCAGLTHFSDNEVAGAAHGVVQGGLTPLGRDVVRRMEALRMIVDVAHASPRAVDDVLEMATRPVLVSHTGVQELCPGPRNLSDAQLRRIAAHGGLVGIGFWDGAVGDITPRGIAASIRHAVEVAGVEHVALGSDWDGAVTVAIDAARLETLTQALLDVGFPEEQIRAIMGENALRFLLASLP